LAGFEVTLYGRFWGDRRGQKRSRAIAQISQHHPRKKQNGTNMAETSPAIAAIHPIEKHYKIRYIQARLGLSYEAVRQLVMHEPGVVILPPSKPSTKRKRNTYLTPESVLLRILRRCTNPAAPITLQRVAA
jgi:predicted subunit of tRNA(5-methylaminomethyl-2-thiouridylate) methyltransferase